MPVEFLLSQVKKLPFDFKSAVDSFVHAKMEHRFTIGEAAPGAPHIWVEMAVRRVSGSDEKPDTFEAYYQIVDDMPPPPTLDERKNQIAQDVITAATAAIAKISPPLKQAYWNIEYARVQGDIAKVPVKEGETQDTWLSRALDVVKKKSPEDYASYVAQENRAKAIGSIHRVVAKAHSDIHDLTEKTIDGWVAPNL